MTEPTFADVRGDLPEHQGEVMTTHMSHPIPAVMEARGATPAPAEDRGYDDHLKYSGGL
jgi:hypothetical protein